MFRAHLLANRFDGIAENNAAVEHDRQLGGEQNQFGLLNYAR